MHFGDQISSLVAICNQVSLNCATKFTSHFPRALKLVFLARSIFIAALTAIIMGSFSQKFPPTQHARSKRLLGHIVEFLTILRSSWLETTHPTPTICHAVIEWPPILRRSASSLLKLAPSFKKCWRIFWLADEVMCGHKSFLKFHSSARSGRMTDPCKRRKTSARDGLSLSCSTQSLIIRYFSGTKSL